MGVRFARNNVTTGNQAATTTPAARPGAVPDAGHVVAPVDGTSETGTVPSAVPGGTAIAVPISSVAGEGSERTPRRRGRQIRRGVATRRTKRVSAPNTGRGAETATAPNTSRPTESVVPRSNRTKSKPDVDGNVSKKGGTARRVAKTPAAAVPAVGKLVSRRRRKTTTKVGKLVAGRTSEPRPVVENAAVAVRGEAGRATSKPPQATPATRRPTRKVQSTRAGRSTGRVMIINASSGDECRIAVLVENRLEEFFIERRSAMSRVGNIYKGIVTNVESSIQAVFVDFGLPKHGFLHISDVQPQYFGGRNVEPEGVGRKIPRRERPAIQRCFKRGQEVIVQITKEGVGTKGPTLTTYLSIPGRYLVMMPGMTKLGVSRKIEDDEARRTMRSLLSELTLPKDMGFILRTAGLDQSNRELQRDLNYLQRLWKTVVDRVRATNAPAELYQESDLVTRTVRDVFTTDFERIIVDDAETAARAREFLRIALPRISNNIIEIYNKRDPIFHHYRVEDQIEAIHSRHVPLKSGGSIVIDSTEALVAIDVNSGRMRNVGGEEELALKTNLEAAEEIARQLRLRDLGGLIVCDFIDMRQDRNKRAVEKALRDDLKKHKERARILRMSQFGLIELTRQRQGPPIKRGIYTDCPHCKGSGLIKNPESMMLHVLRNLQRAVYRDGLVRITATVSPDVAFALQNRKRALLHDLETETGKTVIIAADASFTWDQQYYEAQDERGRTTRLYTDDT